MGRPRPVILLCVTWPQEGAALSVELVARGGEGLGMFSFELINIFHRKVVRVNQIQTILDFCPAFCTEGQMTWIL